METTTTTKDKDIKYNLDLLAGNAENILEHTGKRNYSSPLL